MRTANRGRPLVIAHRGASAQRPENTVEAFRRAAELGADWVELDVRRTADGALVVHHDARLPDGRTIVELARADLPTSVATLDQALDACVGLGVNVEIKNDPRDPDYDPDLVMIARVVERLVERAEAGGHRFGDLLVSSFDTAVIAQVRAVEPRLPVGQLFFLPDLSNAERIRVNVAAGVTSLNPWDGLVEPLFVFQAQGAGLAVHVWTVDDPDRMEELVAMGVDGIITNVPDVARNMVDTSGRPGPEDAARWRRRRPRG